MSSNIRLHLVDDLLFVCLFVCFARINVVSIATHIDYINNDSTMPSATYCLSKQPDILPGD